MEGCDHPPGGALTDAAEGHSTRAAAHQWLSARQARKASSLLVDNIVDSIESPQTTGRSIPQAILHASAIVAYQYGNSWPTFGPYCDARPDLAAKGWVISTTMTYNGPSRMYDIESGGGSNVNIGRFMAQADRRWGLPILYTFASNVGAMTAAAAAQGHGRGDYYVLAAHPDSHYGRHICAPDVCGYPRADGTQYTFATPGNCDTSIFASYMLPGAVPPPPPPPLPPPPKGTLMIASETNADGRLEVFTVLDSGQVKHIWQTTANGGWHGEAGVTAYSWQNLGKVDGKPIGICAGSNQNGNLQVEIKLDDGSVVHSWQTSPGGGWNGAQAGVTYATWESLGNPGA